MTTSNIQQHAEQLHVLQERFPQAPQAKLNRLLQRFNGDADQVSARLVQQDTRAEKLASLEERYGVTAKALRDEHPAAQGFEHVRLLKIIARFDGDREKIQKFFQKVEQRQQNQGDGKGRNKHQKRQDELRTKYAAQLAELSTAGIDIDTVRVVCLLERNQGDANKVIEILARRKEKIAKSGDAEAKAARIEKKNRRALKNSLKEVDEQSTEEQKEKHRPQLSSDDLAVMKQLRQAGIRGKPEEILKVFHECNDSVELTAAQLEANREQRVRDREERLVKRGLIQEAQNAYLTINTQADWPANIEQVYLDGNNMMFVVDSLRRLCLNRSGKKTERAIAEIASAWNDKMRIPKVDLVFDLTRQLESIGTVNVSSAHPTYKTTDDMLVNIARRPENQTKNKRTIVVTSDRALASLLHREGCLLVKPKQWFTHCVMVLSPDSIEYEEIMDTAAATVKIHYNFEHLVQRFTSISL